MSAMVHHAFSPSIDNHWGNLNYGYSQINSFRLNQPRHARGRNRNIT
ncbi:MAG: hypothetical protein QXS05_07785 [Candidatus Bathyarchaeia archaeon]